MRIYKQFIEEKDGITAWTWELSLWWAKWCLVWFFNELITMTMISEPWTWVERSLVKPSGFLHRVHTSVNCVTIYFPYTTFTLEKVGQINTNIIRSSWTSWPIKKLRCYSSTIKEPPGVNISPLLFIQDFKVHCRSFSGCMFIVIVVGTMIITLRLYI